MEAHLKLKALREAGEAERQVLLDREQAARREAEERTETVETINRIGQRLAAETELTPLVQAFTDEATKLAGARFGAFYNVSDEHGESYTLYAIAGVPREEFEKFPLPRNTELFGPTFRGEGLIRLDDVTQDPRYGQNTPQFGLPRGQLPVTSYMAVPVVSRTGAVIGGLFLGHEKPAMFPERLQPIMVGVAAQLAIAIDNARLLDKEQRARAAAEAANRAKDEFLAMLSHELRTPLNAIFGWARMLRTGELEGEAVTRALDVIERNANAQAQLIDDMLDVSRIVTGKLRLDVRPVDLRPVVEAALDAVRPAAEAKEHPPAGRAGPAGASAITGDPDRLQQVVWNLLINAVKFTPEGGRVQVQAAARGLARRDHRRATPGRASPPDVLPHVFERFRQGDSTSHAPPQRPRPGPRHRAPPGRAARRHRRGLQRRRGPGRDLHREAAGRHRPRRAGEPSRATRASDARQRRSRRRGPTLAGLRVLVVDDDADARDLVAPARSTRAPRSCVQRRPPRRFAGRAGVAARRAGLRHRDARRGRLRADPPGARAGRRREGARTPAVALTAYGRVEDRLRALSAGYSMHVPKPVDPAELATVVASLAGRT